MTLRYGTAAHINVQNDIAYVNDLIGVTVAYRK